MRLRKRMIAGILAAMMVVSSLQLPGGSVNAAELPGNSSVINNGDIADSYVAKPAAEDGEADGSGDVSGLTGETQEGNESGPEGGIQEDNESEPEGEIQKDNESELEGEAQEGNESGPEGEIQEGNESEPENEDQTIDQSEDTDNSNEEEIRTAQISGNDAAESDLGERLIETKINGVYQFGGAPSAKGNISEYSVSAYSDDAVEYLYRQMLARETSIDVSAYNIQISSLGNLVSGVLNEHPDLYFVNNGYSYSPSGTQVMRILFTYNDTYDDAAFRKNVTEALSCVDGQMSDLEKAIVLHDYLTVNCEYDNENYLNNTIPAESYTAYGTLVNRTAVCQGYALAYKYLLNQVGIDCYMVNSASMNHAWNMIVLDGNYYQVDVTWDDPVWDMTGRAAHTYMFRSDSAFAKHHDWQVTSGSGVVDYVAGDTRYDSAFWTECDSPLVLSGDDCYYISYDSTARQGGIMKGTLTNITDAGTMVQNIDRWPVWDNPKSFWQGIYSGLFQVEDRLFYNDKSHIYSIAIDGTDRSTVFTPDTTEGYIYGIALCQGKVLYTLRQTPNLNGKENVLTADITLGGDNDENPDDIPVESIELSAYTLELTVGETEVLSATVHPENATEPYVIWTSDDESVAVVYGGLVCAASAGSCTITASAGGQKAECSVVVTEKKYDPALDLDNPEAEYTALDDTKISSAADGRPKLLIFYSNTCFNSQSTIESISANIDAFGGVDVYAIESNQGTKESVIEFQGEYGCDEIVFSYDTGRSNSNSLWSYARLAGLGNSITWPVICYIDANNRLQYATIALTSAKDVLSNLKVYCDYTYQPPEKYTITYVLGGGMNSDDNPLVYTSQTDTVILQDAVKDGYRFEGWYEDEDYSAKVTEIVKGSIGNVTLYAKWSLESYRITYILDGGINHSANPSEYTVETDMVLLRDASRQGYQFDGWYSDASYQTRVTRIVKGSTGDITLYAKWSEVLDTGLPEVDMTPIDGNVVMGFSGTYYTQSADKILGRLNEIRLEACQQGVTNPLSGSPLTMNDYVPLKWSADLEAIARLRAAEASVNNSHTRLNGSRCFTVVTTNGVKSTAENLAWNSDGLMKGIEQWYEEKSDWVNKTGKVTGHYTSIISPEYTYVGLGAFRLSVGGWYSVAQEFGRSATMDERKDDTQGKCVQYLEVAGDAVKKVAFDKDVAAFIREGDSYKLPLNVTASYSDYYGNVKDYSGPYLAGGRWKSSDQTVAEVDNIGTVTAKAKGTATITARGGIKAATTEITVYGMDESPIQIRRPDKTTYKVGQKLDVSGGKVTYMSEGKAVTEDIKAGMVSGFDSTNPGICAVTVTCGGYAVSFDTLIVAEPKLTADCGHMLREIDFPVNAHGTYSWKDDTQIIDRAGVYIFEAVFTPDDEDLFQRLTDLEVQVTAQMKLGESTAVDFKNDTYTYNGVEQEPKLVVSAAGVILAEGQDYTLSYQNNINAGTATVIVEGMNYYYGSISRTFEIMPAQLEIKAKDKTILIGERIPEDSEYEYTINGLAAGDLLAVMPSFSCDIISSEEAGRYEIVPYGADAGANYNIVYMKGRLVVSSEYVSCAVAFDMQGHGEALADYVGIKVGATIDRPDDPAEEGYRFDGWYRDAACTKIWNFNTDIVQSDMILYAKWLDESGSGVLALQEISDVYYTGKACKPVVSVYDGETLLKAGKDYQIKYFNNINANANGMRKEGNGQGAYFNEALPYVAISGKGNYTEVVKVNFNILKTSIGDGSDVPTAGVTLKVTDQLVKAAKVLKPFSSIKYVKAMSRDKDYTLSLTVVNARDAAGKSLAKGTELSDAVLPAGYEGEFLLTIQGIGNYEGSISKTIQVKDKVHLIKNAKITLGKNLKKVAYEGKSVELTASEVNSPDTFTVKCGNVFLKYNKDYKVSYRNNSGVGKAELVITGMGEYAGSKTATFNITGRTFSAKTVTTQGIEDKVYTGRALTQNDAVLVYAAGTGEEHTLQYGTDYTISYSKNVNKGTVTMTFKGAGQAGFSGSFKKTFKITAADIAQVERADGMQNLTFNYCKAGVKPVKEIVLTNQEGIVLYNGKDYTLKYTNNKAVAKVTDVNPPTITVKGKGNYAGEFEVYFDIERADLEGNITVKTSPVAYNQNKAETYVYKPAVKLMDGKTALRAGTDYEIVYVNNSQADYEKYIQKLQNPAVQSGEMPRAVITEKVGANYKLDDPIIVPLPIYHEKLTKSKLTIEVGEAVYTGGQVTPAVTVYYTGDGGRTMLHEGEDYSLSYGANIKSGKGKGSVTVSGLAPYYGGNVTVKFEIKKKPISY